MQIAQADNVLLYVELLSDMSLLDTFSSEINVVLRSNE